MSNDQQDYGIRAVIPDWRCRAVQSLDFSRTLIEDHDQTFFEATRILSSVYLTLHKQRGSAPYDPGDERSVDDQFWGLQRSSTVIDCIVGSACVSLMRWIDQVKRIAIGEFTLLETEFPLAEDQEFDKETWARHHHSVMHEYGSRLPGKTVTGALAVWQVGNVFKHSNDTHLRSRTKEVARALGFSSQLLEIPEHDSEGNLRQMALQEVDYTLGSESIERMGLILGCGPEQGLMPLYRHVKSWQRAIDEKLLEEQIALRKLL